MGTKVRSAVVVGLLCLSTACAEQGTPAGDGQSNLTPPTTANDATPTAPAKPECPAGTYQVTSLTAKDSVTVSGAEVRVADVQGLTLEFADGNWTLTGDGATISVSAGGLTASATLDGTATGSYAASGDRHVFTQESAEGQLTLDQPVAGIDSIPMSEFGPAIAPSGTGTITCTGTGANLTAENALLELTGGTGGTGGTSDTGGGAPAGEPAPAVFNSSGQSGTYSCTGGPVAINGSDNTLTFTGVCETVNINGGSNHVTVASAGTVNINGSQNRLTWTDTEPRVNDNGRANTVDQG